MKYSIFALSLLLISLYGCKEKSNTNTPTQTTTQKPVQTQSQITIVPIAGSKEYPDATMLGRTYKDGKFNFNIKSDTYQLGAQTDDSIQKQCANSSKGQHIHLIVDDKPYAAKYTSDFDYTIEDGEHYVLTFLGRSYHESIKNGKAHIATKTNIKNKSVTSEVPVDESMIFYSRPKGTYVGDETKNILLDYFLINPKAGQYVQVDVNGTTVQNLKKWQPYVIKNLPMGKNTVTLTLIDSDGNKVSAPLNPVSRTFELKPNPEDELKK